MRQQGFMETPKVYFSGGLPIMACPIMARLAAGNDAETVAGGYASFPPAF
jgi:hypothetical protein